MPFLHSPPSSPHPSTTHTHTHPIHILMTRTARATFPRALIRDRSESKSGLDKSFRKGGGGQHNWGSIADEGYLEAAALQDEQQDSSTESDSRDSRVFIMDLGYVYPHSRLAVDKYPSERRSNSFTEEEKRSARNFRKTVLKGQGHNFLSTHCCFLTATHRHRPVGHCPHIGCRIYFPNCTR